MLKRIMILWMAIFMAAFLIVACGPKKKKAADESDKTEETKKPAYKSNGDEGTVTGKIMLTGAAPAPKRIDMGQDAKCGEANSNPQTETYMVSDGKVQNVFVYLKGGPADKYEYPVPSESAELDQRGCRYNPHVLGVQAKQDIKITNSDATTHNIHPTPTKNQEWNESQAPGSGAKDKSFSRPETLIKVKCNVHPWMTAYIGVLGHSFYAVSGKDGSFTIKNVPPGDYTLVTWHEDLGEQTQKIKVTAKGSVTQDVTYNAKTAYLPTSMNMATVVLP
ncbi:MAG: hypothetical protein DMF61_02285 [Blastocatellia bacterium AA13]|nr:MAG: hypothetical protein DMF61_02285 [Blastocatellia bacterium AA13]